MTDPASDPRAPGERRLAHPPSDRYRTPEATVVSDDAAESSGRAGSPARGVAFGTIAAVGGAVATVILGGALAVSAGLVVVAAATGYAVGLAVIAGSGRSGPRWVAVGLALVGILVGQLGLWLFARTEGGVLPLPDYLGQTFGPLVPLQALVAVVVAWWSTR